MFDKLHWTLAITVYANQKPPKNQLGQILFHQLCTVYKTTEIHQPITSVDNNNPSELSLSVVLYEL